MRSFLFRYHQIFLFRRLKFYPKCMTQFGSSLFKIQFDDKVSDGNAQYCVELRGASVAQYFEALAPSKELTFNPGYIFHSDCAIYNQSTDTLKLHFVITCRIWHYDNPEDEAEDAAVPDGAVYGLNGVEARKSIYEELLATATEKSGNYYDASIDVIYEEASNMTQQTSFDGISDEMKNQSTSSLEMSTTDVRTAEEKRAEINMLLMRIIEEVSLHKENDLGFYFINTAPKERKFWGKFLAAITNSANFHDVLRCSEIMNLEYLKDTVINDFIMKQKYKKLIKSEGWKQLKQSGELYDQIVDKIMRMSLK